MGVRRGKVMGIVVDGLAYILMMVEGFGGKLDDLVTTDKSRNLRVYAQFSALHQLYRSKTSCK
jgi:hypothetical protein